MGGTPVGSNQWEATNGRHAIEKLVNQREAFQPLEAHILLERRVRSGCKPCFRLYVLKRWRCVRFEKCVCVCNTGVDEHAHKCFKGGERLQLCW